MDKPFLLDNIAMVIIMGVKEIASSASKYRMYFKINHHEKIKKKS